ncbi:hypothetical protein J3F83DRAFT_743870 [Trichoderma novae-zelandiae]
MECCLFFCLLTFFLTISPVSLCHTCIVNTHGKATSSLRPKVSVSLVPQPSKPTNHTVSINQKAPPVLPVLVPPSLSTHPVRTGGRTGGCTESRPNFVRGKYLSFCAAAPAELLVPWPLVKHQQGGRVRSRRRCGRNGSGQWSSKRAGQYR